MSIDLLIYVTNNRRLIPNNVIAWAAGCNRNRITNRPDMGQMNINIDKLDGYLNNPDKLSGTISTYLHEITHLLGFSGREALHFINPETREKIPVR